MKKQDSLWGVGPLLFLFTVGYFCIVEFLRSYLSLNDQISSQDQIIWMLSGILLAIGLPMLFFSARTLVRAYKSACLYTDGLYAYCRNPLYASFILFIIPAISLSQNSYSMLTIPVAMYVFFRIIIKREEKFLIEQFGDVYREYKKEVYAVFPFKKKRCQ